MRTARGSYRWLGGATLLGVAISTLACGEQSTQPRIDGIEVRAAKGGNGNGGKDEVTVKDTDPPGAPQDTELTVTVTGSGFDETSEVTMLLDEQPTGDITTLASRLINSRKVEADIRIAADAALDLFDVEVTAAGGGKRGIGIELFEVTEKSQECQFGADLTLDEANPVRSDGLGVYRHGEDRVSIGTGSGDGFRFDTNGSQKLEANNDRRRVTLDFSDQLGFEGTMETDVDGNPIPKGIDLRFVGNEDGTRLNLCALDVDESGMVPIAISFLASDVEFQPSQGANASLRYGGVDRLGFDCGAQGVAKIQVTRKALDRWELVSGPSACLNKDGVFQGVVAMPIAFTLVAQP